MNRYGSYRKLLGNSIAAMSAAIEIYNKPKMDYRDECSVILLINAWELLLKAILSKSREPIYYPKKRNQPYRTLTISDALKKAQACFPTEVDYHSTAKNLECLIEYRDQAIHFYNEPDFGVMIYTLAQTAIVNYRDLVQEIFQKNISDEISLSLLPLALSTPVDPIAFLNLQPDQANTSKMVAGFTARVRELVTELESANHDTGRFMTVFKVNLVSTKKVAASDLVVGVQKGGGSEPLLIHKNVDPNKSHPHRQKDIVGNSVSGGGMNLTIGGKSLTTYIFQAILFHYKLKEDIKYCWADRSGGITRYSPLTVDHLKKLTAQDVDNARNSYRQFQRDRQNKSAA